MTTKSFVLFDLGGTLVDLRGIVVSMADRLHAIHVRDSVSLAMLWASETASRLPAAQGSRFRPEQEIAEEVLLGLLQERGKTNAHEESARLVREAWELFVRTSVFQPDASFEWLRALRSQVAALGLVTDGDSQAVASVLAHLGLGDFFDAVTISEEVRSYKPHPRIYRAALKALGAKASASLFVSDAALDLQGAVKLGMGVAWIPRDIIPHAAKPPRGTLVLNSLHEIDGIVGRFSKAHRFRLS